MVRLGCWQIDLPDYFVARYFVEFVHWAKHFDPKSDKDGIGPIKGIMLREGYYSDENPNGTAELKTVQLLAKRGRRFVEVEAYRENDKRKIWNHCQKMKDLNIPPRAQLIEPPRQWLPFMPTIGGSSATDS